MRYRDKVQVQSTASIVSYKKIKNFKFCLPYGKFFNALIRGEKQKKIAVGHIENVLNEK